MGGNFLHMSERSSPTDKGPIISHHWAPLSLYSSIGVYQSVSVLFSILRVSFTES